MLRNTPDQLPQKNPTKLEEKKDGANNGVAQTAFTVLYWKNEARKPEFWKKCPHHGAATRSKPLFKDSYMEKWITPDVSAHAEKMLDPKLALALAVRHKYLSKTLSKSVKSKDLPTKQVVILGSGYDTRPVRKKKYGVKFFEIDKPEVLTHKKMFYEKNQLDPNAVYIGIDYLQEDFIEHLKKAGVDTNLRTHFIWEGNTMYLPEEKVYSIIEKIKKNFDKNALLSFDYLSKDVVKKMLSIRETNDMIDKFKNANAPMVNGYNDIRKELADKLGLVVVENRACAELTKEFGVGDKPYVSQENYFLCTLTT